MKKIKNNSPQSKEQELLVEFAQFLPVNVGIIGYGSSITKQNDTEGFNNQIDFFVIVDDPIAFHKENIKKNSWMYNKTAKNFFSNKTDKYNKHTDICYIPDIKYKNAKFKMGVISKADVIKDNMEWNKFYIAPRLQKKVFFHNVVSEVLNSIEYNRESALALALLLLEDEEKTKEGLVNKIVGLSYRDKGGRSLVEGKSKVSAIAGGSLEEIFEQYTDSKFYSIDSNGRITVNYNQILQYCNSAPEFLKSNITNSIKCDILDRNQLNLLRENLKSNLSKMNKESSKGESKKGLEINGLGKSIKYGFSKISKKLKKGTRKLRKKILAIIIKNNKSKEENLVKTKK